MSVQETISRKLTEELAPQSLNVIDESHLHAGHAGAREGGESHFRIHVIAERFDGMTRVARQRLINQILRDELAGPVHALAMKTETPAEANAG